MRALTAIGTFSPSTSLAHLGTVWLHCDQPFGSIVSAGHQARNRIL
jgi:hypothetical protein